MEVSEVLTKSWEIIWRHKILWIFGIFAGCSGMGGGINNLRASYQGELPPSVERFFESLPPEMLIILAISLFMLILILTIVAIFFGTIGRIGVVAGAQKADRGTEQLYFGELFKESLPYFWRVFLLNLGFGLAVAFAAIILAFILVISSILTLGIALLCAIPVICPLIPLLWAAGIFIEQASIAIITEGCGVIQGLQRAWEAITQNIGAYLLMGLILSLGVNLFLGFLISLPLFLSLSPAIAGFVVGSQEAAGIGLILTLLSFIAYLPIWLVLNGILRSYYETAWTLTYLRVSTRTQTTIDSNAAALAA